MNGQTMIITVTVPSLSSVVLISFRCFTLANLAAMMFFRFSFNLSFLARASVVYKDTVDIECNEHFNCCELDKADGSDTLAIAL